MAEKPARTGPGTCGPGKIRPACMKKADPGIDFQCPAVSRHGTGHSTKNPEPGPVPAFLLSKKKRGKYKTKIAFFLYLIPPNPTGQPTLNHEFTTILRNQNRHLQTSSFRLSTITSSHHLSFTDGDAVLTVDRASPSTNRKAQLSLVSSSKISSRFGQLLSGSHHKA